MFLKLPVKLMIIFVCVCVVGGGWSKPIFEDTNILCFKGVWSRLEENLPDLALQKKCWHTKHFLRSPSPLKVWKKAGQNLRASSLSMEPALMGKGGMDMVTDKHADWSYFVTLFVGYYQHFSPQFCNLYNISYTQIKKHQGTPSF